MHETSASRWWSVALAGLALTAMAADLCAEEITLKMKGGDFEVSGELKSFDLQRYIVDTKDFGPLTLDAKRYDCVRGACPKAPVAETPVSAPLRDGVDYGATTWIGGSVIGTDFMPLLIDSYANTIGAKVSRAVAADPRNLEFKLTDRSGGPLGQVNVNRLGVTAGFEALASRSGDVVMSSRPISPDEVAQLVAAGLQGTRGPASEHVWGSDAIVALVARDNPAVSLSLDAIANIFAGNITDWSQVGLPAGKINVYAPSPELGDWEQFETIVMKPRGLALAESATRLQHATDLSDRVAADPFGIAINSIAEVRAARALNIEQSCGLITRPSIFAAKTEEYPLTRRMYFYTAAQPTHPLANALLKHALSPRVQDVLKKAGLVDLEPESQGFAALGSRITYALNAPSEDFDMTLMRKLIADLKTAQRVSLTFRFASAGVMLDSKALADVQRLRVLLESPDFASKTVMLVGFSDAVGAFATNLAIADQRAQAVLRALTGAGPIASTTIGAYAFGELAPVACNDTAEARQLNRRVEVWVKD
jgi:phosphate transport system substrate-binding protein